jgi:hypothetical protein
MAALIFRCPRTGKEINTGIDADPETRRSLNILICRVPCPYCRFDHFPQVKRGEFVSAACEELPAEMTTLLGKLASPQRRARPGRAEPSRTAHDSRRVGLSEASEHPSRWLWAD